MISPRLQVNLKLRRLALEQLPNWTQQVQRVRIYSHYVTVFSNIHAPP